MILCDYTTAIKSLHKFQPRSFLLFFLSLTSFSHNSLYWKRKMTNATFSKANYNDFKQTKLANAVGKKIPTLFFLYIWWKERNKLRMKT
jgi:hypothetical protein